MSDEKKFHFKGKFFETEEEFWKIFLSYQKNSISTEDLQKELDLFVESLILNHRTGFWQISGERLNNYINECLLNFFRECDKE